MKYLLDTNIVCENTKTKPHSGVVSFLREVSPNDLFLSALTVGEIRKGIEKMRHHVEKRDQLHSWLENYLKVYFSGRIIGLNIDVAEKWGYLIGNSRHPLPVIDSLIAATAICYNLVLVTRNVGDFAKFPLEIFNPYLVTHETAN